MKKFTKYEYIQNGYISAQKKHMNSTVNTHCHDFFEIEYIVSGSGSYTIDGTQYPIEPGLIFFMTPINFHNVEMKNAELYNIMFSGNICNMNFLSQLSAKAPVILKADNYLREYFKLLMDDLEEKQGEFEFGSALLNVILAKLNSVTAGQDFGNNATPIRQLELYLLNNFRNKITLEDAAKHIMFSPTYVSQLFKKETGTNFKTYLNSMRYEYAKKLLTFSDMTVIEICNECGFDDYPNFIRRFKQYTGAYPVEYRKNSLL